MILLTCQTTYTMAQEQKEEQKKRIIPVDVVKLKAFIHAKTTDPKLAQYLQATFGKTTLSETDVLAHKELQHFKNPYSPIMAVINYLLAKK